MAKYRKKPVIVGAEQWFKNGDHPKVKPYNISNLRMGGYDLCGSYDCNESMYSHGQMNAPKAGGYYRICPNDWIVTELVEYPVIPKRYPIKPDIFEQTYEKVEE